ncbi:MAG: hypothetical protein L0Z55_13025 [Planctomycetes bacterium]|nr:hypothetical protein [Planctomycetota bacterium]
MIPAAAIVLASYTRNALRAALTLAIAATCAWPIAVSHHAAAGGGSQDEAAGAGGGEEESRQLTAEGIAEKQALAALRRNAGAELHLLHDVCQSTGAQRAQMATAADECMLAAAKEAAIAAASAKRDQLVMFDPEQVAAPRAAFLAALAAAAARTLTPEQTRLYDEEIRKRAEFRKAAAIQSFVALIDSCLLFSVEQRAAMERVFAANWNTEWEEDCLDLLTLRFGERLEAIPLGIRGELWNLLDEGEQRNQWRKERDAAFGVSIGRVRLCGMLPRGEWIEGEEEADDGKAGR